MCTWHEAHDSAWRCVVSCSRIVVAPRVSGSIEPPPFLSGKAIAARNSTISLATVTFPRAFQTKQENQ